MGLLSSAEDAFVPLASDTEVVPGHRVVGLLTHGRRIDTYDAYSEERDVRCVVKLLRDPQRLEILGDGSQAKPYVGVADLVAGIRHAAEVAPARELRVLNVGPEGTLAVRDVAEIVVEALDLPRSEVEFIFTGRSAIGGGGWPGDTAHVAFDTSAMRGLGWRPTMTAEGAVRAAAIGIAERYRASARPLLTAAERRSQLAPVGSASA